MQYRPSDLLYRARSIGVHTGRHTAHQGVVELCDCVSLELSLQTLFIILAYAPEELEGDTKKGDANAGDSEHGLSCDVPRGGKKAGIDGVPVPDHLSVI